MRTHNNVMLHLNFLRSPYFILASIIIPYNSTLMWFEPILHYMLQPHIFLLVHSNVLPDYTV